MSLRMDKVNSEIKHKVADIIRREIDDPHLGLVSITRVRTTSDLRESRIFFSVLDNDFVKAEKILNSMKGFIRLILGREVRLKILPQLVFVPDDSIKYSVDIYNKIEEVRGAERRNRNNKEQ